MNRHILWLAAFTIAGCTGNTNRTDYVYFDVNEEVEPATINFDDSLGEASLAKNFYFLFDVSGSMNESCAGDRKIAGAQKAITEFLGKVPDEVNIGLLFFGVQDNYDEIQEMVPLGTGNKEKFHEAIAKSYPQNGTPLGKAISLGMNRLIDQYKRQLGYGEYRLIVITDGMASNQAEFEDAMRELKRYPFIALYGIGLCMDETHLLKSYSLKYTDAFDYSELGKALEETIAESEDFDPTEFTPESTPENN
jgi:uncharacterized protein with von Willebrand factor type A (vWA) domain